MVVAHGLDIAWIPSQRDCHALPLRARSAARSLLSVACHMALAAAHADGRCSVLRWHGAGRMEAGNLLGALGSISADSHRISYNLAGQFGHSYVGHAPLQDPRRLNQ